MRKSDSDAQGHRMRDHLWLEAKHFIHHEEPSFERCERDFADDLAAELTVPAYCEHSTGAIMVEAKDAIKRRNKDRRSPDLAEGLLMTFYQQPFASYVGEFPF